METLENLSNNEIRLKCIEFGLPNVPVTDSSRKILIKRLHEAMKNAAPKESSKASTRRETINIGKAATAEVEVQKSRRTISAATSAPLKEDNAPTAIPISTRRRSVQKDSIEPTKPTKAVGKPLQTILIEDDEDDAELAKAVDNAEKASTGSSVAIENITSRRKSRSVSVPKITEVNPIGVKKRAMTPLVEGKLETSEVGQVSKDIQPKFSSADNTVNIISVQKLPTLESPITLAKKTVSKTNIEPLSQKSMQNTTPSVYSTPSSMRYTIGSGASTAAVTASAVGGYLASSQSLYRTKYTTENILNELSDTDAVNDDGCKSPFLSSYARELERRRSVGRSTPGSGYSQYTRRSGGSNYGESTTIRGRGSKADVSISQIADALSRKYHLKTIFYLLVLMCISIFVYVYLYA